MALEVLYNDFYERTKNRKYQDALSLIKNNLDRYKAQDLMMNVIAKTLNNLQTYEAEGYQTISAFQILAAAKITKDAIDLIKPILDKELAVSKQEGMVPTKIIIGNAFQDHHALGKEIVKTVLSANGFDVIDLGLSVPASEFVDVAVKENAKWIYVSAMMFNTALGIQQISEELKKRKIKDIKLVVGGAPFKYNYNLYKKIKTDYMAEDALDALEIVGKKKIKKKVSLRKRIFRFFGRKN
ncbi:MAG: cobalamin B12-binding domain-containing protein [Candidatus Helarchaeota archaeon]